MCGGQRGWRGDGGEGGGEGDKEGEGEGAVGGEVVIIATANLL